MKHYMRFQSHVLVFIVLVVSLYGCNSGSSVAKTDSASLAKFSSCRDLRSYIEATAALEQDLMGFYGGVAGGDGPASFDDTSGEGTSVTSEPSYSETNVQEAGVDEPDFVKTDGPHIYAVRGGYFLVLKSWPANETVEISRTGIEGYPSSLFVHNGTAIVFSSVPVQSTSTITFSPFASALLKATLLDISDPETPAVVREMYFDGVFNTARMVDGKAHVVITSGGYAYAGGGGGVIVDGGSAGGGGGSALASSITAQDAPDVLQGYFPKILDVQYTAEGPVSSEDLICSCENVYRPDDENGTGLVTIFTIDLNDPLAESESVSIIGGWGVVYGSPSAMYVAESNSGVWVMLDTMEGEESTPSTETLVHKFSIDSATGPEYIASGRVNGWVLSQFSMSEWNGDFRIATTDPRWWTDAVPENSVYVLRQDGTDLDTVGTLSGLGKPGESIFAVRFLEEKGFVVTFQQTDPLYTIDLSVPEHPQVVGSLEVPGFSTYLHPAGDNHLLAVGRDPSTSSTELSIYDISDFASPVLVDRETLGAGSYSSAEYEHKAFTYYPELHALAIPVTAWNETTPATGGEPAMLSNYSVFNGLYLYSIDLTSGFSFLGSIDHSEFYQDQDAGYWYYPDIIDRSLFIGTQADGYYVYSVSGRGLKATEFNDLMNDVAAVEFPSEDQYWYPNGTVVY